MLVRAEVRALHPLAAQLRREEVHDRAPEVGLEVVRSAEVSEAARHPDERLLDEVLRGLSASGQEVGEPPRPWSVPSVEFLERPGFSPDPHHHIRPHSRIILLVLSDA
jgi:hypothetical protein